MLFARVSIVVLLALSHVEASANDSVTAYINKLRAAPDCRVQLEDIVVDKTIIGEKLQDFERRMNANVIGQEEAVNVVVKLQGKIEARLVPHDKPYASILLLGPTGIGKTQLVIGYLRSLGLDWKRYLIKINCAEFQAGHEISKITAPPPGYAGHGTSVAVFDPENLKKRRTPEVDYNVVLFDEIEKAGDTLSLLQLGLLDKGEISLGDNRDVDMRKTVVFSTSNLGVTEMRTLQRAKDMHIKELQRNNTILTPEQLDLTGRYDHQLGVELEKASRAALEAKYSPEYLNRYDRVIYMKALGSEQINQIAKKEIATLQARILSYGKQKFVVLVDEDAKIQLANEGTSFENGARELKRTLEEQLMDAAAAGANSGQIKDGDIVLVGLHPETGDYTFTSRYHNLTHEQIFTLSKLEFPDFDFDQFNNEARETEVSSNSVGAPKRLDMSQDHLKKVFDVAGGGKTWADPSSATKTKYIRDKVGKYFVMQKSSQNQYAIEATTEDKVKDKQPNDYNEEINL